MRFENCRYFERILLYLARVAPLLCIFISVPVKAQEPPPRPIVVTVTAQSLSFGAFTLGAAGGTVAVDPAGSRSSSGDVILLGMGYSFSPAWLEIDANPGTLITILNGPPVTLTGSNGGLLTLTIGSCSPASPFVTTAVPPATTPFYVGGTITVGNISANPTGSYNGSFNITFVQE
jgi:hypothetical protein